MRAQLTAIGIALVTAGCGTGNIQGESAAHDASPSDAMESPGASVAAIASASPDPTPASTPHASVLEVGGFADVVTTDLVVRSAPGVGADSEIYGTIEHIPAYIVAGPVDADGFAWWLVAHARHDQLGGPPAGWVAAAGKDGEVWLAPTQPECPPAPTGDEAAWFNASIWVSCYTGVEMTLEGALGGCAASESPVWDNACWLYPCEDDVAPATCLDGFDLSSVILHFDGVPAQQEGRITVSGHFDDPDATRCAAVGGPLAPLAVFECRTHFVVTSSELAD